MSKGIWEIEEKIRAMLLTGVEFPYKRKVAASIGTDMFTWIKVSEDTNPKRVFVVYIKGAVRVTVNAVIRDDGSVDIESVSLDTMCGKLGAAYG